MSGSKKAAKYAPETKTSNFTTAEALTGTGFDPNSHKTALWLTMLRDSKAHLFCNTVKFKYKTFLPVPSQRTIEPYIKKNNTN